MLTLRLSIIFVLLSSPVWAATITCTGTSFPFNTPTDPQAQDYTVPSVTNGITFAHFTMRPSTRTIQSGTTTIGGNTMTRVNVRTTSTDSVTEVFYRLNVASGVQSISADFDAAPLSYVLTAVTCENVNQTTPIAVDNAASGTVSPVTVDCAGTTGSQLVLDFVSADNTGDALVRGANQTEIDQDIADGALSAGVSSEPGNGGTVTMSNTFATGDWATICAVLNSVGGRRTIAPLVSQ